MKVKWGLQAILLFSVYAFALYVYLFHYDSSGVPAALQGTAADPSTFMTEREIVLSENYSTIRNFLFLLTKPLEWFIYFFMLLIGLSKVFERWSSRPSKWAIIQIPIYVLFLSLFMFLLMLPIRYFSYIVSVNYGISIQSVPQWLTGVALDFCIDLIPTLLMVGILYFFIRVARERWWIYVWLVTIPVTLFFAYIQPVIIEPLFNDFSAIENKELEQKILALADEADIPADRVYEVKMADQTNAMNAYVSGIGKNTQIVLWDTTLANLSEEEILFVMAHEMGHYAHKDIYKDLTIDFVISFFVYWFIAKLMKNIIQKNGQVLNIKRIEAIHSLPLYLLISSILFFAISPLYTAISRHQEIKADNYAIELVEEEGAGISTFQALAKSNLNEANPPIIVKWFRYSHPPLVDRINNLENEIREKHD